MLYFLWFISILLNVRLTFRKKYNLIFNIIIFFTFALLFILLGWINGLYDIVGSIMRYENYQSYSSFTEVGYTFYIFLCHLIGLDARGFLILTAFIILIILFRFYNSNSKNLNLTMCLFIFFPMVVIFQYTRNLFAFSFVLFGLNSLLKRKRYSNFKFLLSILVGTLIHSASLFFIVFLFAKNKHFKFILIFLLLFLYSLFIPQVTNLFDTFLIKFVGYEKANMIFQQRNEGNGLVGLISLCLLPLVTFLITQRLSIRKFNQYASIDKYFLNVNLSLLLLVPMTFFVSQAFSRLALFIEVVNLFYFSNLITETKSRSIRIEIFGILFFFLLLQFILLFRNESYRELVLYPFFEENTFLVSAFYDIL